MDIHIQEHHSTYKNMKKGWIFQIPEVNAESTGDHPAIYNHCETTQGFLQPKTRASRLCFGFQLQKIPALFHSDCQSGILNQGIAHSLGDVVGQRGPKGPVPVVHLHVNHHLLAPPLHHFARLLNQFVVLGRPRQN